MLQNTEQAYGCDKSRVSNPSDIIKISGPQYRRSL